MPSLSQRIACHDPASCPRWRSIEVHIAGGSELAGLYGDGHSGAPHEPVWSLLDDLVGRAPNLRGITFEFHDSCLPVIGFDGVADVIVRAAMSMKAFQRAQGDLPASPRLCLAMRADPVAALAPYDLDARELYRSTRIKRKAAIRGPETHPADSATSKAERTSSGHSIRLILLSNREAAHRAAD